MTNKELRKKYLIGTKVKYVLDPRYATPSAKKDIGKIIAALIIIMKFNSINPVSHTILKATVMKILP